MTRLACLIATLFACAHAPPAIAPPPLEHWDIAQFELRGCGDFCSMHAPPPTTRVWGSIELRGDRADVVIQHDTATTHVICPSVGPLDPMTPCVPVGDPRAKVAIAHAELALDGAVTRTGQTWTIAAASGDAHVVLICSGATCTIATSWWRPDELPRAITLEQPAPMRAPAFAVR
jgi:hypothetical protein